MAQYLGVLLDMDGILQVCGQPVPGAREFVCRLQAQQIPYVVLTNECRYTNEKLASLLCSLGVPVTPGIIYTAANSCADFLKGWSRGKRLRVLVVGESGLIATLASVADVVLDSADDIDYVVIGAHFKDMIKRVELALEAVKSGAKLLYTCPDSYEVDAQGHLRLGMPLPQVEVVRHITGVTAFNTGKPNANMAKAGLRILGVAEADRVLMVGDSLDTDVRLATENGIDSALVLSAGETSREKLRKSCLKPDFCFGTVLEFSHAFFEGALVKRYPMLLFLFLG